MNNKNFGFGTQIRKSPYFDATVRWGATGFSVYNHMYIPRDFGDPEQNFWNLIETAILCDVAVERQVEITGPDAFKFIQLLTPRDLSKLSVGQCKYVLITNADGGVLNDPVLLRLGENHFWLSLGDSDILLWAQGVAVNSGLDVKISEPDVSPLQISGPKSGRLIQKLFNGEHDDLGYYKARQTDLNGIPMVIARTGWSGELSYELYLQDGKMGNKLFEIVHEAAQEFNGRVIAPNIIRSIEGGILSYGGDFGREHNPFTIGLGRLVNLDQEIDFIGKEALKAIKEKGLSEKLVGVELDGDPIFKAPENFWSVKSNNKKVGRLSRAFFSPRLKKNIGLAIIDIDFAEEGTTVSVASPNGDLTSTVVSLPWFQADKENHLD